MEDERNLNATEVEAEAGQNTPKHSKEEKEATANPFDFQGEIGIKNGNYSFPILISLQT